MEAYYDVETTGLEPGIDAIVEVGVVYVENGETIRTFSSLVNPGEDIVRAPRSAKAFSINQIPIDEILAAPSTEFVAQQLRDLEDLLPCLNRHAFNISFDKRFLSRLPFGMSDGWGECVMLRARDVLNPGGKWLSLVSAAQRLGLEYEGPVHRALSDARMAYRVHAKLNA